MKKEEIFALIDENKDTLTNMALTLWENPEIAHEEYKSSQLQKDYLRSVGFSIREIPDNPTSFIAEYGNGKPIIGITGEYDALPNLSQKRCSAQEPEKTAKDPGHGCGHNLLGTGSLGAAVAVRQCMEKENLRGTLRYYGCAAEETLAGKPLMELSHVFDDLDACISWHPSFMNTLWECSFLAMNSMKFRFKGTPSHAAAAPEAGRSALDAVELMDIGANYLREHVIDQVRIHYTITNGGGLPNTVPAEAEVWYYVRAPKRDSVRSTVKRLLKIAEGAALMTETQMTYELLAGCYDVIPNYTLGDLIMENMKLVSTPGFDSKDIAYAEEFTRQLSPEQKQSVLNSYMAPNSFDSTQPLSNQVVQNTDRGLLMAGSTDVGDVSYLTPFAQFTAACWPVGISSHTWMSTACTGTSIGCKGMLFAAKVGAVTLYDLFTRPDTLKAARQEFMEKTKGITYISPFDE